MKDIDQLVKKYGVGLGVTCGEPCAVWLSETTTKGYVRLIPPEPGVVWCRDPEDGLKLLLESR